MINYFVKNKNYLILVFNLVYLAVFTINALIHANLEFLYYTILMVALIYLIVMVNKQLHLAFFILVNLSILGFLHLLGGNFYLGATRLYDHYLVMGAIRYDNIVHTYGTFIITLISCFFLSNVIFSFDWPAAMTSFLFLVIIFFLILQSLWSITLEKSPIAYFYWALGIAVCLFEVSIILWFWPSSPTIVALFLTGFFYIFVGLSHAWLERKLFKNVMWEYIWVGAVVFFILMLSTSWRG